MKASERALVYWRFGSYWPAGGELFNTGVLWIRPLGVSFSLYTRCIAGGDLALGGGVLARD
jgi:hypothetical protein